MIVHQHCLYCLKVLPQVYGGEAPLVPIEEAVHARLVKEGLELARSFADNQAAEDIQDAEGRLTRAGRYCITTPLHLLAVPCTYLAGCIG